MELLLIGLDGAGEFLLNETLMPFLCSLRDNNRSIKLTEDLFSRGWSEIFTGQHGSETGGLYQYPLLNGTYEFSPSFSCTNQSFTIDNPLWSNLNRKGLNVGMQNLPTCFPAPSVNGFFVSGGGGGNFSFDGVPEDFTSSESVRNILLKNNYTPDVAFRAPSHYHSLVKYIDILYENTNKYFKTFIELSQNTNADIGFFIEKLAVEIFFLAAKNIFDSINHNSKNISNDITTSHIIEYLQYLDNSFKYLFEILQPKHFIVTSDHSTVPFTHEGNLDVLLTDIGYMNSTSSLSLFINRGSRFLTRKYNAAARKLHLKHRITRGIQPISLFHPDNTLAFSTFYDTGNIAGIYINDNRFNGPVSINNIDVTINTLMDDLNNSEEFIKYNLKATIYRDMYSSSKYQNYLPDITIEKADGFYFSGRDRNNFLKSNPKYISVTDDVKACYYPTTGAKGRHPLLIADNQLIKYIDSNDVKNLTIVYKIIDRYSDDLKRH